MRQLLESLFGHQTLTREEAKTTLTAISSGSFNSHQVTAFLTVFRMRGITVEELTGFRDALLELCKPVDLSEFDPVDLCGTGGDNKDTFNISTLASFVAAGAGVNVAKHGNYAVSSSCGSSNMMEYLGYTFTNEEDRLKRQIEQSGICFLHAPLFHPAMKEVAPIRKEMGVRTFFNMLGPMVNPARPRRQMVGVFSLELLRFYQYIYQGSQIEYRLVHSLDGYDEISLTSDAKMITPTSEVILTPESLCGKRIAPESLYGGQSVKEAAEIFTRILEGKGTREQVDVVCVNAGVAIQCRHPKKTLPETIEMARESLTSGKAKQSLHTLLSL
jgi:anthranilate phosphoribosyltransferase